MNYLPSLSDDWKDVTGGGCWDRSEEVISVDLFIPWFCFKPCYIHWKNPYHCALLGYMRLASTLGLSLLFPWFTGARTKHSIKPLVSRMWKLKCFHRRSEEQLRTEALNFAQDSGQAQNMLCISCDPLHWKLHSPALELTLWTHLCSS